MARTRAEDYDAKRLAILDKAAELFARHGYAGTSVTMLAEACGVSKALLYHYYPDKESVLFDILHAHLHQVVTALETVAARVAEPRDRLHALAVALLDCYDDKDKEHHVQVSSLKLLPDDKQEQLKALERRIVTVVADAIAEALPSVGRGRLLKPLTMSWFGMLNWQYMWFREGRGMTRAEYAALATEMVLSGAEPAAAAVAD